MGNRRRDWILINTIESILILTKGCIIMLDDVFDNLVNEIGGALADSHKEYIIASIIETASLTGEIDIRNAVVNVVSIDDIDECFNDAIVRNTSDMENCVEIIVDWGIQNAIKLWVESELDISSENVPSESDLALKILDVDYYMGADDVFDKIIEYLTFDEDVMDAIEKCKGIKSSSQIYRKGCKRW